MNGPTAQEIKAIEAASRAAAKASEEWREVVGLLSQCRTTLEQFACRGYPKCDSMRMKDGTCIREIDGTCGQDAHSTLYKLDEFLAGQIDR